MIGNPLKPIIYTKHASREMINEGIEEVKVEEAIRDGQTGRIGRDKYRATLRVTRRPRSSTELPEPS